MGPAGLKFASLVDTWERNIINEHRADINIMNETGSRTWTMNDALSQDNVSGKDQVTCPVAENHPNVPDFPLPTSVLKEPYVLKHDNP